jgi:apolipoprotein N-acyltransferase
VSGWWTRPRQAAVLAAAAGLAIYLAHPPAGLWPAAFAAPGLLVAAVRLVDERRARDVAGLGLLAGLVAYLPMIVWLATPAGYLAWVLLASIQAAYLAVFAWLVRPTVRRAWVVVAAPMLWVGQDAWRALWPLSGFGWGEIGYAHVAGSWMLPMARIVGVHGLTLMTALVSVLAYDIVRRTVDTTSPGDALATRAMAGLPSAQRASVGLAVALLGSVVLTVGPPAETGATLDVLGVQGNALDEPIEDFREEDRVIAQRHLDETVAAVDVAGAPDLAVWAESAIDRDPYGAGGQDLLPFVTDAAAAVDGNLLFGSDLDAPDDRFERVMVLADADGAPVDRYQKRHLVPFGEFVPARSAIGWFPGLDQVPRDAIPGPSEQSLAVNGVPIAVGICFESLFPTVIRDNVLAGNRETGAGFLVIATNDHAFGPTAEPAQHLDQSRMRAVETGRWVLHVSISGRSSFVDPEGRLHGLAPLWEVASTRREVPVVTGLTPFLAVGDVVGIVTRLLFVAAMGFMLALAVLARRRGRSA